MRHNIPALAVACGLSLLPGLAAASLITVTDASQLDFSGTFEYAYNFNGTGTQKVGDAFFVNRGLSDVPPTSGFNNAAVWGGASNLGSGADNDALENVMRSIIWSRSPLNPGEIDLAVTTGGNYRLQLLFSEAANNLRSFDVQVENFPVEAIVGIGVGGTSYRFSATQGYALAWDFTAADPNLDITLSRRPIASVANEDTNYHISGLTLERIEQVPVPPSLSLLSIGLLGIGFQKYKRTRSSKAPPV